ncbi:MAG TPA: NADH-quinone oxidoreductase subunit NuoG [bacterium]|nr:NADH-quinone oxidoreductase subunit NuoG [bacterium]HQL61360.1 NADH-quinone oxidoreductase subunit NuoG [bacterium]
MKDPHRGTVIHPRARPFAGDAYAEEPKRPESFRKPVTATIDGQSVTVEAGTTILQAAQILGIYIPHYCYHPALSIVASCRLCLVEVEKSPKLVPSCSTPVGEGQVIFTRSDKAKRAREQQMQLLLINHPLDCPVCDQGGHCQLQRYSMDYGTDDSRYRFPKRTFPKPNLGPFIDLERNRCILCTRCVRFLEEIAGNAELAVMKRGNDSLIGTFLERPLHGEFSGNTIDLCPVGSLTDKVFRFRARIWELEAKPSVCPHCAVGCNILLDSRRRTHELLRITPRTNPDVNGPWICDKGRFGFDFVNSRLRVRSPLVKRDGELKPPADGMDVIEYIVAQWKAIRDRHGPGALAGLISPRKTNESLYLFQRFFRKVIGSGNIDHRMDRVGLEDEDGYLYSIRIGARNDPVGEVRKAETIFILGSDLPNELPILNLQIRQRLRHGATLLVAHHQGGSYRDLAARYCAYHPGAEMDFLAVLFFLLVQEKNVGFPGSLIETYRDFNSAAVANRCGVAMEALQNLARALANASNATLLLGEEAWAGADGIQTVRAFADMARAMGLFNENDVGINLLLRHSNSRGAIEMGVLPHLGPGLSPADPKGKNTHRILQAAAHGELKSLFILGEDLIARYPDRALAEDALKRADFVVVADTFVHDTARAAHVFLPIATFDEIQGSYTNVSGKIQQAERVLVPLSGTATPLQLLQALARRFGAEWDTLTPPAVFDILRRESHPALPPNKMADYLPFQIRTENTEPVEGLCLQRGPLLFDRTGDVIRTPALSARSQPCTARLSPEDVGTLGLSAENSIVVESPGGRVTIPFIMDKNTPSGSVVILGEYDDLGINRLTSRGNSRVRIIQEGE